MAEPALPPHSCRQSLWIIRYQRVIRKVALGLVTGMLVQSAAAQEALPLKLAVVLGGSVTWDSNVFRLPDSVNPLTVVGRPNKNDRIHTAFVGLRIDKSLAQQRFQLDVTKTITRFNSFSFLDFDALDYRGAWLWRLTPRLSGTLSFDRRQTLAPFADIRTFQRNISNTDSRRFSLDGWLAGGWHLLLGVFNSETKFTQVFLPQTSFRSTGADAGLRYVAASGSSITATRRSSRGTTLNQPLDPVNFIDNGFRLQESELVSTWLVSGKSTLNGRLAYIERSHENFPQRDFSGLAGNLDYTWTPTGKLRLNLSVRRDRDAWWEAFSSYRVSDTLSITPIWQVSAKNTLRMQLSCTDRDFRGPVFVSPGALRNETLCSAGLGADWTPQRYVTVSATLQRDRRSSNFTAFEFDDTIAVISASLMF